MLRQQTMYLFDNNKFNHYFTLYFNLWNPSKALLAPNKTNKKIYIF